MKKQSMVSVKKSQLRCGGHARRPDGAGARSSPSRKGDQGFRNIILIAKFAISLILIEALFFLVYLLWTGGPISGSLSVDLGLFLALGSFCLYGFSCLFPKRHVAGMTLMAGLLLICNSIALGFAVEILKGLTAMYAGAALLRLVFHGPSGWL